MELIVCFLCNVLGLFPESNVPESKLTSPYSLVEQSNAVMFELFIWALFFRRLNGSLAGYSLATSAFREHHLRFLRRNLSLDQA